MTGTVRHAAIDHNVCPQPVGPVGLGWENGWPFGPEDGVLCLLSSGPSNAEPTGQLDPQSGLFDIHCGQISRERESNNRTAYCVPLKLAVRLLA
jgi:hypothetical protein